MGNLISLVDPRIMDGEILTTQETYGQNQYLPISEMEKTNEIRIIKRRKLRSRFRTKVIFK